MSDDKAILAELEREPNTFIERDLGIQFLNLMPDSLRELIINIPREYLDMSDSDLKVEASPTRVEYGLRVSFWREYERIAHLLHNGHTGKNTRMTFARIALGVCSTGYLHTIVSNPAKLAWMLRPVRAYMQEMEVALLKANERLWEILDMPLYDSKGRANAKMAQVMLAAVKQVEERVHGMAVQRKQALQVNINGKRPTTKSVLKEIDSIEAIDERIRQLEGKVKGTGPNSGPDISHLQDAAGQVFDVESGVEGQADGDDFSSLEETLKNGIDEGGF